MHLTHGFPLPYYKYRQLNMDVLGQVQNLKSGMKAKGKKDFR